MSDDGIGVKYAVVWVYEMTSQAWLSSLLCRALRVTAVAPCMLVVVCLLSYGL